VDYKFICSHCTHKNVFIKPRLHDTTCCQSGCTTRFDNLLNKQWLFVQHGCQTSCHTNWNRINSVSVFEGLKNEPQSKINSYNKSSAVVQPVGCLFTRYSQLSNQWYNWFDNWLYLVNGVLQSTLFVAEFADKEVAGGCFLNTSCSMLWLQIVSFLVLL